jgi:hypothetical protein
MTSYLARLKAIVSEKGTPHELPKLPKAPAELPKPPFGSFGSEEGRHVLKFDVEPTASGDGPSTPAAPSVMVASLDDRRAAVEAMRDAMSAETAAHQDWHKQPVEGWREGRLEIRSVIDGSTTVIRFPRPKGRQP